MPRRRGTWLGAALLASFVVVTGTSATLGAAAVAAAPVTPSVTTPMLTSTLPADVGNGGDLQAGSVTIDNTGGTDIANARLDVDITPVGGTGTLSPSDFVLEYEGPSDTSFTPVTFTADTSGGGVNGFIGPADGAAIPAGQSGTAQLKFTSNPTAPTGDINVTFNLDTTPGDTSTSIANSPNAVTLSTPTLSFLDYPSSLPAGGGFAVFSASLTNNTGSNYGGSTPTNSPTPAGVRIDFDTTSTAPLTASDITLQYCLGGTGAECSGGTWSDIPLSDSGGHVTGEFGPTGGFSLPDGASNTTELRVSAAAGTQAGTATTTATLDKVDSSGSPTGTDSTGVDNGPITSTQVSTDISEPRLTLNLPDKLGNGGDLQPASATIDNTGGPAISGVRVDLEITPDSGTPALSPSDFVIKLDTGGGNLVDVPLVADDSGGGLHGYAPPEAGFTIDADHSDTTNLMVASNPSAPTGGVTVTANLDTTPGNTSTSIATATHHTALVTPSIAFNNYPPAVNAGGGFVQFSGTLANTTGSNYGGTDPTATPTPAGVRVDYSVASNDSSLSGNQVLLQFCGGASDPACTNGTWKTIALTGTGTLIGSGGPTGGFVMPDDFSTTTQFRLAVNRAVPNSATLALTATLDKVDSSGSPTGTDSSGVDNGPIVSARAGTTHVGGFVKPRITARIFTAHPKSKFGWYRSAVTVFYTCHPGTAGALRSPCPGPTHFRTNGTHRVTKTITAVNGVRASVTVKGIKIDHTDPHVRITGARNRHTYASGRILHAHCRDALSGIASCHVSQHRKGHTVHYRATVRDKAGNVVRKRGEYFIG